MSPPSPPESGTEVPAGEADASLTGTLRALIDDGQTLFEAELAYARARATYGWGRAKGIVALLLLALAFAFFTLVALVVGLLLALTPLLTPWGALAFVGLGLGGLAAACFATAVGRFRKARAALLGKGTET
ncbi:phage holin family protein [Novosphingobium sp. MD-1]|uniref:phage holin family protein n=1 Tax=Novosphingobium sp. MD-1 TaxID=1630648 RepID=UPI00061C97FC|nr:phage holin family protein [Novosphingobium sp. MD-1]GAO55592.1 hypothetical protein NMD1_02744 [Novosphingobium sp. MD-1]